jgi:hypothetical protein
MRATTIAITIGITTNIRGTIAANTTTIAGKLADAAGAVSRKVRPGSLSDSWRRTLPVLAGTLSSPALLTGRHSRDPHLTRRFLLLDNREPRVEQRIDGHLLRAIGFRRATDSNNRGSGWGSG